MDGKHTPGPWTVVKLRHCQAIEVSGDTNSRICTLWDHHSFQDQPCGSIESQDKTQAEIDANARIIAAAPELLAACKSMSAWDTETAISHPGSFTAAMQMIRAAIAKSEGGAA